MESRIPRLVRKGWSAQLVVDDRPFLILGGELGNSTASSLEEMERHWPRLASLGLNTVLAPVYWELVEPEEGAFDFSLVDGLIEGARRHGLRLALLWFGSWKNCMSCYAPPWVKLDPRRFPRARTSAGKPLEMLSAFHEANEAADARAFAALMRHLREVDGAWHTVIMVQVENEIGMIPEARDHSETADRLYRGAVPAALMEYLAAHRGALAPQLEAAWERCGRKAAGSWEEVFGPGPSTEELFMAWHFARYVERVAAAGKAEYPLPMFVNAALIRPGYPPGRYASGGPLPHLMDVWRAGAPSIDFLAPDIYFPNVVEWCERYRIPGNPLFIPEIRRGATNPAYAFYAIGDHSALGISPFAIEDIEDGHAELLAGAYRILRQLEPVIAEHQGRGTMRGAAPDIAYDGTVRAATQALSLDGYRITVTFESLTGPAAVFGVAGAGSSPGATGGPQPSAPGTQPQAQGEALPGAEPAPVKVDPGAVLSGGLVIALGDGEFLVAGTGIVLTFESEDGAAAGILSAEEGEFAGGRWMPRRRLNGDQTHQGRHIRIPPGSFGIQRFRLYRYE